MQISQLVTVQDVIRRATRGGGAELKAIRAEYSELRKIANKRIKRAQAKGELLDVDQFMTTTAIMKGQNSIRNLAYSYSQVVKFLRSETSTAKGRKIVQQRKLKTLETISYTGINESNIKQFQAFMEQWRIAYQINTTLGKRLIVDSDEAAEFFDRFYERIKRNDENTNANKILRIFKRWLRGQGV